MGRGEERGGPLNSPQSLVSQLIANFPHGWDLVYVIGAVVLLVLRRPIVNLIAAAVLWVGEKVEKATDEPVMREKINSASENYFEEKRYLSAESLVKETIHPGSVPPENLPDELELVHELWRPQTKRAAPDALPDPDAPKKPQ